MHLAAPNLRLTSSIRFAKSSLASLNPPGLLSSVSF
jgi:hypothetical protein